MTRLLPITAEQMERGLLRLGFERIRQKGSHVIYRHPDGRTTTVPFHASRQLAKPLLREILREIRITPEEFYHFVERH